MEEYLKEFVKSVTDPVKNYFGLIERPSYENRVFDDPHVHYPRPRSGNIRADLIQTLDAIVDNLDRTALTTYGNSVSRVLRYQDLLNYLSSSREGFSLENRGVVSILRYKDRRTEIYSSQEIRTKSHIHITAEGCEGIIPDGLDPMETVERIHKQKGIAIVEHPCTKEHRIRAYVLTNEQDDELTKKVFEMADCAEVFNSYNTLWMFRSNVNAKKLVDDYNKTASKKIAVIAGSGLHIGTGSDKCRSLHAKQLGKTGIFLPKHDLKSLTGREIIEQKRQDLQNGNYYLHDGNYEGFETYTGPITFFFTMIPLRILRELKIDMDSVS